MSFLRQSCCFWPFHWPFTTHNHPVNLLTATAEDLQQLLTSERLTSVELVEKCLAQIDKHDGYLRAVLEKNPYAKTAAAVLDRERMDGRLRGPLHGIPILIKDNIATHPSLGMNTTAGSLALVTSRPRKNADVVDKVLAAGMIILGKTQLSELAGFKGAGIMPGWSAVGGQTQSAYTKGDVDLSDTLLGHSSPAGSSTGSAVSVSAGYAPLSVGTDTGGSLITPSTRAALYTLRPTMGLVSQDGLVPLSRYFDTPGPMAKSVVDLANLLDVMVTAGPAERTSSYAQGLMDSSLKHIRIGFLSPHIWNFNSALQRPVSEATEQIVSETQAAYAKLGRLAKSSKEVELVPITAFEVNGRDSFYDIQAARFKPTIEGYLQSLEASRVRSLEDLIKFNDDHRDSELPLHYANQDQLLSAAKNDMSDDEHDFLLNHARHVARDLGIDRSLNEYGVDVIIAPGDSPVNILVSAAGYPSATMPLGTLRFNGRPIGLTAFTTAYGEKTLLKLLRAFEVAFPERPTPDLSLLNRAER